MAANAKFTLSGVAELDKALRSLGPRVATNVSARALRAMAKPIVQTARILVPVDTGILKKSITTKLGRVSGGQRTMAIGFKKGPPGGASWRAHFVEFGTAHSPAQPFMRPALDEQAHMAFAELGRVLGEGIELEAVKRGFVSSADAGESEGDL